MTLRQQQLTVQGFVLCTVEFERTHTVLIQARQLNIQTLFQNLWHTGTAIGSTQHPPPMIQKALALHIANGTQAVKPAIGHMLDHRIKTLRLDALNQPLTWHQNGSAKGSVSNQHHIAFLGGRLDLIATDPVDRRLLADRVHKCSTCFGGVFFDVAGVHGEILKCIDVTPSP